MPEVATYLAAMRTGKIDYLGWMTQSQLRTVEQAENLGKTNGALSRDLDTLSTAPTRGCARTKFAAPTGNPSGITPDAR